MKLSNILTVYVVILDALAVALLLTATCMEHSFIAAAIGTIGLVTLHLVGVLKSSERVIAKIQIYVDESSHKEREKGHEANKDR